VILFHEETRSFRDETRSCREETRSFREEMRSFHEEMISTRSFPNDYFASNNCCKHAFSHSWSYGPFVKNNDRKLLCHKADSDADG